MPLPHGDAVGRGDLLEHLARPFLADLAVDTGQPVGILLLDAEPALPLRVGKLIPRLRQLLFFTSLVLYACTKTLSRVPTHSPCGRMAGAIRSL